MIQKKKKKACFGFSGHIQGRFRPFPACFSRQPIRSDFGRINPVWCESKRIRHESSRVGAKPRKKKNTADADQRPDNRVVRRVPRHAMLDASAAPLVPRPCFLVCKAVQVSHMQRLQLFLKCPELAFFFFLSRLQHAT